MADSKYSEKNKVKNRRPNILLGVLNWGLGHATRCMPIIKELQEQGANVFLASDGDSLQLLQLEYPNLPHIVLPSYDIHYSPDGQFQTAIFKQSPKVLQRVLKEQSLLKQLIQSYKIDGIISDNRYGLWSKEVPAIFMTHQVFIQLSGNFKYVQNTLNYFNHYFIRKFNQCWIPDVEGNPNLSGILSHQKPLNKNRFVFIGPLSRLNKGKLTKEYDLFVMLSGPEPQRGILEKLVLQKIKNLDIPILMTSGKTQQQQIRKEEGNLTHFNYLNAKEVEEGMNKSNLVLCRSGYSSIMDLAALDQNAILIPTPGQSEQEYLANYYKEQNLCYTCSQTAFADLDIETIIQKSKVYRGFLGSVLGMTDKNTNTQTSKLLKNVVNQFLSSL